MKTRPLWLTLGLLLLLSASALAGDFRIVPGRRIGTVSLGMSRISVHAGLHTPNTVRRLPQGLVIDTWLSHRLLTTDPNGDRGLKRDYLIVFFRHGRAVQIEVSSAKFATADGLSTLRSASEFAKRYPHFQTPHFAADPSIHYFGPEYAVSFVDPTASSPAAKHFVFYGDARLKGIAWKYGTWGDLAPEPDPYGPLEAMIVHLPGQVVLLNPNDGLPYSGTGPARK